MVYEAWKDSGGDLPTVHMVVRSSSSSQDVQFQWPLMALHRPSDQPCKLIEGFDDLDKDVMGHRGEKRIRKLMRKLVRIFGPRGTRWFFTTEC